MAFLERREINMSNGSETPSAPIDQSQPEIIEDFSPAKIHVFCDLLDVGGQILFSGDTLHLIVAIRRKGSQDPEPIEYFNNGVAFGPDETLFIGSLNTHKAIAFDYNPTFNNHVLARFEREKKD